MLLPEAGGLADPRQPSRRGTRGNFGKTNLTGITATLPMRCAQVPPMTCRAPVADIAFALMRKVNQSGRFSRRNAIALFAAGTAFGADAALARAFGSTVATGTSTLCGNAADAD